MCLFILLARATTFEPFINYVQIPTWCTRIEHAFGHWRQTKKKTKKHHQIIKVYYGSYMYSTYPTRLNSGWNVHKCANSRHAYTALGRVRSRDHDANTSEVSLAGDLARAQVHCTSICSYTYVCVLYFPV